MRADDSGKKQEASSEAGRNEQHHRQAANEQTLPPATRINLA
jgi:hypothetical protein